MRKYSAFSLIEVSIVILLVVILSVYVMPKSVDVSSTSVQAQASRLASDIKFIQSHAIMAHQLAHINFTSASCDHGGGLYHCYVLSSPHFSGGNTTVSFNNAYIYSAPETLSFDVKGVTTPSVILLKAADNTVCRQIEVNALGLVTVSKVAC